MTTSAPLLPSLRVERQLIQSSRSVLIAEAEAGRRFSAMSSRFPGWVYRDGEEPDPRFSLANERTFLAWIRTSLALIAAGVALEALALPMQPGLRLAASVLFIVLGLLAAVQSWLGWARTERALRQGRALPGLSLGAVVSTGLIVAVLLVSAGFLIR